MHKKTALSAIILTILSFSIIGQVLGQATPEPGVKQGDTFKYNVTYFWDSTNPSDIAPTDWVNRNATEWYQATIGEITGTTVNIATLWRFLNGTEISSSELVDVGTGYGGSLLVYAANLRAQNYLYPSSQLPWIINSTDPRSYGSASRETNHIQVNMTDREGIIYSYIDLYFDVVTGVMVEANLSDVYTETPEQTFTIHLKLEDTNAWDISGSSSGGNDDGTPTSSWLTTEIMVVILVVIVVIVVAVTVLLVRKRKSKTKRS